MEMKATYSQPAHAGFRCKEQQPTSGATTEQASGSEPKDSFSPLQPTNHEGQTYRPLSGTSMAWSPSGAAQVRFIRDGAEIVQTQYSYKAQPGDQITGTLSGARMSLLEKMMEDPQFLNHTGSTQSFLA